MANITLRETRALPLSNEEVDANFNNLNVDKLEVSQFTGNAILARLLPVDGAGSGLDADFVDGLNPTPAAQGLSIVSRDASGNFSANNISASFIGNLTGNISGNAATVTNGVYITDVGSVTNTMLAGGIANSKLINSSITINNTPVSLGGSINITGSILAGNNIWTGTQTFRDNRFLITDDADTTRRFQFEVSGISTNTIRTMNIPNANGTIATQEYVQTTGRNSQGNKFIQTVGSGAPASSFGSNGDIVYQY